MIMNNGAQAVSPAARSASKPRASALKARPSALSAKRQLPLLQNSTAAKSDTSSTTSNAAPNAQQLSQRLLQATALVAAHGALVGSSEAAPVLGDLTWAHVSEVASSLAGSLAPVAQQLATEDTGIEYAVFYVLNNPALALGVAAALVAVGPRVIKVRG